MKLFTASKIGNKYGDLVMIVANLCDVKLDEVEVQKGSK